MNRSASLAVIGGDLRHAFLAQLLREDGHTVTVSALERHPFDSNMTLAGAPGFGLSEAQAVILPMPVIKDEGLLNAPLSNTSCHIETILNAIPPGVLVLGGRVPESLQLRASQNNLRLIDYLEREELAIRNAVPAALAVEA